MSESQQILNDVNDFFTNNQQRYELFSQFQDKLDNLNEKKFGDILEFVTLNKNIFFKDHSSTIFFFYNIIRSSEYNFKIFEIYLDIIIYFSNEIKKQHTTENELIVICFRFPNTISYLFSKKFFSIQSIIDQSFTIKYLFINFLPEIEEYDPELAEIREKNLFPDQNDQEIQRELKFYKYVKNNRQNHLKYRNLNYHPSPLHKAIREDDIETFQSLLSKNNLKVNSTIEFSFYERSQTVDYELSPIRVAAVYGSLAIFKFLWLQNDIVINHNLLNYAYFGQNYEIIHLCEQKCNHENVCVQAIRTHQHDLLEYYIENYSDKIKEDDEEVRDLLNNFLNEEEEDNLYDKLNFECLISAVFSFNFEIIKKCLPKIAFIARNLENVGSESFTRYDAFLYNCCYDLELFKFLYFQRNSDVDKFNCECYMSALFSCLFDYANDSFKFIFYDLKENVDFFNLFQISIENNHDLANFILDVQNDDSQLFEKFKKKIQFNDLILAIQFYNEDVVVKIVKLYKLIRTNESIREFVSNLMKFLSKKMIIHLLNRLFSFLHFNILSHMTNYFIELGFPSECFYQ